MRVEHRTMIHGRCPINGATDYYELSVCVIGFLKAEDVEATAEIVRGSELTQEDMLARIKEELPLGESSMVWLRLTGRHGQNVNTIVEACGIG